LRILAKFIDHDNEKIQQFNALSSYATYHVSKEWRLSFRKHSADSVKKLHQIVRIKGEFIIMFVP